MSLDPTKCMWVVKEGSIYTVETQEMRSGFPGNKKSYHVPMTIAFNVGDAVAHCIVETHNAHLMYKTLGMKPGGFIIPL